VSDSPTNVPRTPSWTLRLYALVLRLYPRSFRAEYGEEMITVYADLMENHASQGLRMAVVRSLREYAGLIVGAMREHLRRGPAASRSPGHLPLRGATAFAAWASIRWIVYLLAGIRASAVAEEVLLPTVWSALLGALLLLAFPRSAGGRAGLRRLMPVIGVLVCAVGGAAGGLFNLALSYPAYPLARAMSVGRLMVIGLLEVPSSVLAGMATGIGIGIAASDSRRAVTLGLWTSFAFGATTFAYYVLSATMWHWVQNAGVTLAVVAFTSAQIATRLVCGAAIGAALAKRYRAAPSE
jgi:hypothetical protein